jgi:HSP20 family protein
LAGHRDPLQELLSLQERINRLFEESLGRGRPGEGSFGSAGWVPLADVYETKETYFVLLELPGVEDGDLEVVAETHSVTIKGERRLAASARPESFNRMERSYGPFARVFRFEEPIDADHVDAQLSNGLMRLAVPKDRPRSEWRVRVERAGG